MERTLEDSVEKKWVLWRTLGEGAVHYWVCSSNTKAPSPQKLQKLEHAWTDKRCMCCREWQWRCQTFARSLLCSIATDDSWMVDTVLSSLQWGCWRSKSLQSLQFWKQNLWKPWKQHTSRTDCSCRNLRSTLGNMEVIRVIRQASLLNLWYTWGRVYARAEWSTIETGEYWGPAKCQCEGWGRVQAWGHHSGGHYCSISWAKG